MSGVVERKNVGARVADARRGLGLSQKGFAESLGISLWALDRIEAGITDVTPHLPGIADLTSRSQRWFRTDPVATVNEPGPRTHRHGRIAVFTSQRSAGRDLVLASIALLVVIRFFTEVVPVIPRAANFVDIPILVGLVVAAWVRSHELTDRLNYVSLGLPAVLFLGVAALSTITNPSRVQLAPALVFVYGFLAPFGVYAAVYRLWTPGQPRTLSQWLAGLAVVQLAVVLLFDLPHFLVLQNPDVISGTFGTNQYQLVFFLLVCSGLLAGIFAFEKGRLTARVAPFLILLILATIFLAQYRALLATTFLTFLLIGILLGSRGRGIVVGVFVGLACFATLAVVSSRFPILKLGQTISTLTNNPGFYASRRLHTASNVATLYSDHPRFILTGTGPGTFSSRGFQTFASAGSKSKSNVQGQYVGSLTGSSSYHTDVSDKYVTAPLRQGPVIEGSKALASPYSDYLSLLAEVGIFGFTLITGVYVLVLISTTRLTLRVTRRPQSGDALPALAIASTVALFVLVQMAALDNWLEVTRLSFVTWALLAVTHREADWRRNDSAA
jgi:hypothetical protein